VAEFLLVTDTTVTAAGRSELWQRAIYMLQDFPYTGIGLGTFSRVMPVLYPAFTIGPDAEAPHAHSLYLQMGIDLGIPGLVAGMALITAFLLIGISAMRRTRNTEWEGIAVGAMGGFVVYLVHGLVDNVTFSVKPGMVIWTIIGLTTALWLRLKDS
jgi:putative inorganic carbon (HCO3(-)) transporter